MAKEKFNTTLKGKTEAQLKTELTTLRKEQMNLRFQKAAGSLTNFNRWRMVRKAIAQVKTALNLGGNK